MKHGSARQADTSLTTRGLAWPGLPDDSRLEVSFDADGLLVVVPPRGLGMFSLLCLPLGIAGAMIGSTAANQVLLGGGAMSLLLLLFGSFVVLFAMLGIFEQTFQTKQIRVSPEGVRLFRNARDAHGILLGHDAAFDAVLAHLSVDETRALRDLVRVARAGQTLPR